MSQYQLEPLPSQGQLSFYRKAKVSAYGSDSELLTSYNTEICIFDSYNKELTKISDYYSLTTMKHINAFLNTKLTKKQWQKIPVGQKVNLVDYL